MAQARKNHHKEDQIEGVGIAFRIGEALGLSPHERALMLGFGRPVLSEDQLSWPHRTIARIDERVALVVDIKSALAAISGDDIEKERKWINTPREAPEDKTPRSWMTTGEEKGLVLVASLLNRITG